MTHPRFRLNEDEIETFQRDGALCLRSVFDAVEVTAMQTAVDAAIAAPGPNATEFGQVDNGGRFFADVFVWTRQPVLENLVVRSPLGEIAAKLMRSSTARFFFDHLLVKEALSDAPTPWHQDAPYFPIRGVDCISIWIALDYVTPESGAVEYVKGSHSTGKIYAPESFSGDGRIYNEEFELLPDIDSARDNYELISWNLKPGDCAVHHVRTIHGAPGNNLSDARRRGLATRWIGDDIVYEIRPGIPEPMIKSLSELAPELREGEPYESEIFPLIWEQNNKHN